MCRIHPTGEKKIKADEFLPIFCQIKKEKDQGTIEDFIECMKLYDKTDNGTMVFAELQHILMALGIFTWDKPTLSFWNWRKYLTIAFAIQLGERLEEKEVDDIMAACCDPEDEDGLIPYKRELFPFEHLTHTIIHPEIF